jgi:hypothetical protein
MSAALDRLYGAAEAQVSEIVSRLSESERATLAVFCIGRAHLHAIGLAIAAQCSLDHLTKAAGSSVAGSTLYAQSRALPLATPKSHTYRRSITLAAGASSGFRARPGKVGTGFPSGRATNQELGAGRRFEEKSSRSGLRIVADEG